MLKRNRKRESHAVLLAPTGLESVEEFVKCLNTERFCFPVPVPNGLSWRRGDYQPVQRELRRLIEAWRQSGPNVSRLLSHDPVLAKEANNLRALLIPTNAGWGHIAFMSDPETLKPGDPLAIALGLFFSFLANPQNQHLCGPCPNCGRYFARRSERPRVYCSKSCGMKHTSRTAVRMRRQRESDEKLKLALTLIDRWNKGRRSQDWKAWVIANHPEITKHWLTRAVNAGLIKEPAKRKGL